MKRFFALSFAAIALLFACGPEENNPAGTDEPGGKDNTVHVTGISLDRNSATIKEGEYITLVATVTPSNADNKSVSWSSSSDAVATVDASGKVTGIKTGSATITAITADGGMKASCVLSVEANLAPSVTVEAKNVSAISAVLAGKANLGSTVASDLVIGFQYSKSAGILPQNSVSVYAENVDAAYNYTTPITGLEPATKYYFRSFVRQNGQDTYGETKNFTTKDVASMVHTQDATPISAVNASLNASLDLTDVQYETKSSGFYWGSSADSVNSKLSAQESDGSLSADLLELTPSKEYFFCAYIILDGKEYKEEVVSFTTKDIESLFGTLDATGIEATKANLNAKLDLTDVKYSSKTYGIYWGTSETSQNNWLSGGEIKNNVYSASLTGLSHKTKYWYKAYVKLDSQTFYGEVKTFTTDVVPVESVSLDKTEYTFNTIGNTLTLKATVLPTDATDKSVSWTSDKEAVATVDANGKVTAIGNGTANITVTTKDQGKTATCVITVAQWVTSIGLDKTSITLNEGQEQTLTSMVNPSNATDKSLNWTSSNTSVATVNAEGKVTAVSKGTATIKAEAKDGSGKYATCSVTVIKPVSSIQLNKASISIYNGKTETLTATVTPSDASNKAVTWTSSNTSIATVSSSGVVTGNSKGTATITVTAKDGNGAQATCAVEVKQYVTSITLDKTSLSLEIGAEATLSVTSILPDNANDKSYTWSSSDSSIASVDNSGKVTARANGNAIIKATANDGSGVFASCSVFVIAEKVDMGIKTSDGKTLYWSTRNLCESGFVNSPVEYGDYFAWGETESYYSSQSPLIWKNGKSAGYIWASYKWCNGSYVTLTKYNTKSSYGTVDNKTVLEPEDDVAHVKLGGKWRMPTDEEWTELRTKCTWTWTTNYNGTGVKGQIVTATNGNSIFLPAAGFRDGTNLSGAGSDGFYWSSSLDTDTVTPDPWFVSFDSGVVYGFSFNRYYGLSVRPVCD